MRVPSRRPRGMEWLNGPLVWAIDATFAPLYLLPRDCPRIVMWRKPKSTEEDVERFLDPAARMTVYVEKGWLERIRTAKLIRYGLPSAPFIDLEDAGMHVARTRVIPIGQAELFDLPRLLGVEGACLRPLDDLGPLRVAWTSSLHVSGVRLRNAMGQDGQF